MTKRKNKNSALGNVLDHLLEERDNWDSASFSDLFQGLKKQLMERILERELDTQLGYSKHEKTGVSNRRNGSSEKTIITETGPIPVEIPRDREGKFEPILIPKHQRRFPEMDEKIMAMYARGMSMRDIQATLEEIYGVKASPELISEVTDEVLETVSSWQNRSLNTHYPILYVDAIWVKIKDQNQICNKAIHIVLGVNMEGKKEVLGLWIAQTEGAKFWLQVLTELKNRGLQDIFIVSCDGLKGLPEAINAIFPQTQVQLCIVHLVRNSLKYVPWKHMKLVAKDLKAIYTSASESEALQALEALEQNWGKLYPTVPEIWRRNWVHIVTFLAYPDFMRKAIYTTNSIEAVNRQIRKVIKTKGLFPNDQAAIKLVFLALQNAAKKWTMPIRDWKLALAQFSILFHDRFPLSW
jgi:putative transposase